MVLRKEDWRLSGRMVRDMEVDIDMTNGGGYGHDSGGWRAFWRMVWF